VGEDTCEKLVKLPVQYECTSTCIPDGLPTVSRGDNQRAAQDNRLKADVSVIADVVVKKYVEHQPLTVSNKV